MHSTTDLSSISGTAGNFNTQNLVYDKNGNIQRLRRLGVAGTWVNHLFYDYSGNQLTRVEDTADQNAGFIDVTSSVDTQEYQYDYSGNMVKDLNKGITDIEYNYLNLPEKVTLDNGDIIHYAYDATGVKHHKVVDDGTPDTTQYVGPYHFTNSSLKFIQHGEGRALKTGGGYQYEYNLTDHLGNVRVTVDEGGTVIQRQDYYPFGLTFNHSNVSPENDYKYNGFEEQKETGWYDYQARFYDPALGRFLNVDPAADLMRRHSTYSYAFNNPIRFIDPDGMMPSDQHTENHSASASTDDQTTDDQQAQWDEENYRTDGYGELSKSQYSEVGDAGRYTPTGGKNGGGLADPLKKAFNQVGKVLQGVFRGNDKAKTVEWDTDGDGVLSLSEANNYYRNGGGVPITVDASKMTFTNVDPRELSTTKRTAINFEFRGPSEIGLVYGKLDLTLVGQNQVRIRQNPYDFDVGAKKGHPWSSVKGFIRNLGTVLGASVAGQGRPFMIKFSGLANLDYKPGPPTSNPRIP